MIRGFHIIALAALAGLLSAAQPNDSQAAEQRTRSFKLVKPPQLNVKRRITIVTTLGQLPGTPRSFPSKQKKPRVAQHGWFWREASTRLTAANPDRFAPLAATAAGKLTGAAQRALVTDINKTWRDEIAAAAARAQVSEALLVALIAAESAGNPRAVSPAGAQGLGQLMPGTAKRFDVADPFEPGENLRGAADYLSLLLTMFEGDALLALAGYNAGENAVLRHNGVPPYAETRDYVPIVLSYYHAAQRLCPLAPSGPRDACAETVAKETEPR